MNTLDALFYMGLGALTLLAFQYAYRFHKVLKYDWRAWTTTTISILLGVMAIGWAYVSFWEHENQAGWMGLLLFGGLGIVFAFLTRQLTRKTK